MISRVAAAVALLGLMFDPGPARLSAPVPVPADRAEDAYRIYSLLLPGEPFAQMASQATGWAVARTTVAFEEMNPRLEPLAMLQMPAGGETTFGEAEKDFEGNRQVRLLLDGARIHASLPVAALGPADVEELRSAKGSTLAPSSLRSKWAGYPGVTYFSAVYFNSRHTAALVYMNNWCAQLCASGAWIYLEKQNGAWVRRSGVTRPGA